MFNLNDVLADLLASIAEKFYRNLFRYPADPIIDKFIKYL